MCVNSAYIKNTYLSHGVAEEKLLIAGDTSCKELYDSFSKRKSVREQLNSRYSFDPKKKILLLSMPQFFEQGYIDEKTHWDDIHYILSQLSLCEVNLAISLHPRQEAARYQFLSEKYPATFIAESLSTVIGAVDYFVCAQSSTLTWSALCGVPALNFDFHLGVDLYHYLKSVRHITTKLQFEKELRTMLREPATGFEEDWKNLSRDIAFREDFSQTFIDQCAQALKNAGFYSSFK